MKKYLIASAALPTFLCAASVVHAQTCVQGASSTPAAAPANAVSIASFGAVANGTTNNASAIQSAFNAAASKGEAVYIPPGNFAYSGLLNANGIAVTGAGSSSILTPLDPNNEALILTGSGGSISNLAMNSSATSRLTDYQGAMILINGASNFSVNHVSINGSSDVGIWNAGGTNGTIENNTVENTLADAITNTNGASETTIKGNVVKNSGDDGISNNSYMSDTNTVNNITVTGNTVLDNKWGRGLEVSGGKDISFTGNYVDNTDGYADLYVASESEWSTQSVSGITATGNTFVGSGPNQGAVTVYNSHAGSNTISGVTITRNTFVNPKMQPVQRTGAGSQTGVVVQNNTNANSASPSATPCGGIIPPAEASTSPSAVAPIQASSPISIWAPPSPQSVPVPAAPASVETRGATQTTPSPTPTPASTTPVAPTPLICGTSGNTGTFHVSGGQIIGPNGQPFIAKGVNLQDYDLSKASAVTTHFTGLNFIRVPVHNYQNPGTFQGFVSQMTSQGRVVEFEDHSPPFGNNNVLTGSALATELAWYSSMASNYAGNPYVWFGTANEPNNVGNPAAVSNQEAAIYKAIRSSGNNNPIMMEQIAGYTNNGLTASTYASMTNVLWDTHVYGWESNESTDPTAINAAMQAQIANAQSITSADGTMPVLIGEYGDSSTGYTVDPNGTQLVTQVINAGSAGKVGSSAWMYPGGPADMIADSNDHLTTYGQMVQLYVNTDVVPLTACQANQQAQQTVTNAQDNLTESLNTQSTVPTPSPAGQLSPTSVAATAANAQAQADMAAADALIQQAQTATPPADTEAEALIGQANANLAAAQAAMARVGK